MKPGSVFLKFICGYILFLQLSCSKMGDSLPPAPPDPCTFISIAISGSVTNPSTPGAADGSIVITATGGSKFTYSINNGAFVPTAAFAGLPAGSYTVIAKNSEGCSGTVSFTLSDPTISCSGVNINVSVTTTGNIVCEATSGSVTVVASGGVAPYKYSLNGGVFQSSNIFNNLPTGSYIITVKDANGCTGTASTTVNSAPMGPLFAQVRSIIQYSCVSCHKPGNTGGGIDLTVDCNIVYNKDRVKARAVDGVPSVMPPSGFLFMSDRQKITNWLNAGGKYSD